MAVALRPLAGLRLTSLLSPRPSLLPSWLSTPLGSLGALAGLLELLPPILLAVPKHRSTHSRKSMRSANKGIKGKTNLTHCEACGGIKLAHNLCPNCYSQISRRWKREARAEAAAEREGMSVLMGKAGGELTPSGRDK